MKKYLKARGFSKQGFKFRLKFRPTHALSQTMNTPSPESTDNAVAYHIFDLLEEGVAVLENEYFTYLNKAALTLLHIPANVHWRQHCSTPLDQWQTVEKTSVSQMIKNGESTVTNVQNIMGDCGTLNVRISKFKSNLICCIFKLVQIIDVENGNHDYYFFSVNKLKRRKSLIKEDEALTKFTILTPVKNKKLNVKNG